MKTSNKSVHFFNPGHETAVAMGTNAYTPDAAVCRMMSDLSLLPLWYGDPGDYVLTSQAEAAIRFVDSLPSALRPEPVPISAEKLCRMISSTPFDAAPWGISPHSLRIFEKLSAQGAPIAVPLWNKAYRSLTHRETAALCLQKIRQKLPDAISVSGPCFCGDFEAIDTYMKNHRPPFLLKMPFSCSGRGLYPITESLCDEKAKQWTYGALKKQGVVSIEPMLEKVCDFAMEFYADGEGSVRYEGLSVFETLPKGTFTGGQLGSPEELQKSVNVYIPKNMLETVRENVILVLKEVLGNSYRGYVGVDMLVYRREGGYAIHPFVEINLRYTMGLVACRLSRDLVHPSSQGRFVISFEKKGEALRTHRSLQKKYPLRLENGKIRSGYFSLCPVTDETNYRASVLLSDSLRH